MNAIFLDFDGVIIDSIDECFLISSELFLEVDEKSIDNDHRSAFYQWRGIVGPAWQFLILHQAIDDVLYRIADDVPKRFYELCSKYSEENRNEIENAFFAIREKYLTRLEKWINLNPLTEFGKQLQNRDLPGYYIVTTKNRKAVEHLLAHFQIQIDTIYDVEDYRQCKNKGVIISNVMKENNYRSGVFVDDSTDHLDSVQDPSIVCYFADWGYGENTNYPVYEKGYWR